METLLNLNICKELIEILGEKPSDPLPNKQNVCLLSVCQFSQLINKYN